MPSQPKYWVVMPAAGSGSRMQSATPKQYLKVLGKAVIQHTLDVFLREPKIKQIMVCLPLGDDVFSSASGRITTTTGGATRAHSVLNGLNALAEDGARDDDWVLVHDAARPCLSSTLLAELIQVLEGDDVGGILAVPAKDTLKQAGSDNRIVSTVDRKQIWQAQTPQMFRLSLLRDALANAIKQKVDVTDEASAIEWAGHKPKLIEGSAENLKVTIPEDLGLVEFFLKKYNKNTVQ